VSGRRDKSQKHAFWIGQGTRYRDGYWSAPDVAESFELDKDDLVDLLEKALGMLDEGYYSPVEVLKVLIEELEKLK
jgi:hypothetical protein